MGVQTQLCNHDSTIVVIKFESCADTVFDDTHRARLKHTMSVTQDPMSVFIKKIENQTWNSTLASRSYSGNARTGGNQS